MAVEIDLIYRGELRCELTHGPSGKTLVTDAPTDNHGKGEAFSPTDLVAGALGSCALTLMGLAANRDNIDITGATAHVTKEMASNPRRIGKLTVSIALPKGRIYSQEQIESLKRAAKTCPVLHSLDPEMEKDITVIWQ